MKRWITALLVLLTAIMFTACGNSNAEKPGATDSADIARDIAAAEVLGDTLATAYENGLPMGLVGSVLHGIIRPRTRTAY